MAKLTPANWHFQRSRLISQTFPEARELMGRVDPGFISQLVLIPVLHWGSTFWSAQLDWVSLVALAATSGAFCRMRTFNAMHELCHGSVHRSFRGPIRDLLMMWVQYPGAGSHFSYYRWFHLSHHSKLGTQSVEEALLAAATFGAADGDSLSPIQALSMKLKNQDRELANLNELSSLPKKLAYFGVIYPVRFTLFGLMTLFKFPKDLIQLAVKWKQNKREVRSQALLMFLERGLSVAMLGLVTAVFGLKSLSYLLISQLFYRGFMFHPCLAFWLTTHKTHDSQDQCQPTSSVYGPVMTFFCGGVNYHVEHHDFAAVPVGQLKKLHQAAAEHYQRIAHYQGAIHVYSELLSSNTTQWEYVNHSQLLEHSEEPASKSA